MLIVGMVIGDAVLPNRASDSVLPQISELIINEGYSITQQQTLTKVAADAMLRAAGDQWGSYQRSLPTTEEVEVSAETVSVTPFKRAVVIRFSL